MSLKNLFKEAKSQYLSSTSLNELTGNIESADYIKFYLENKKRFVPLVDYSQPKNFARFGSAEKYYYDSVRRTFGTYPYDGSKKEKILWELSSSHLDLYLFENGYPRTTGFATFTSESLTATDSSLFYGAAGTASYEYIFVNGGPHSGSGQTVYIDPDTGEAKYRKNANIWDTAKNRECNLKIGGTDGNTVEFWLKKEAFATLTGGGTQATSKEVIFDSFTTSSISSSADYARLRIEMTGSQGTAGTGGTPFLVTYMSGTEGFANQAIGSSITSASIADDSWHHYAFRFKNTGSDVVTDLFIDGAHNHRVTTAGTNVGYVSGTIVGTIGALATYPSGTTAGGSPQAAKGWGKLSGSIDEFRFWKTWRTSEQIQTQWFDQVGGGTNTDEANTDLGVYFKFNEGITLTASTDSAVLDYSGRVSNGSWTGYNASYSRNTGSAIDAANATMTNFTGSEFRDPILYSYQPDVKNFLTEQRNKGKEYDYTNNSNLYYSLPAWIIEEHDANNPDNEGLIANSLWNLTQIFSSYFDELAAQITSLSDIAQPDYRSVASGNIAMKPIPFIDRALEGKGFIAPEIFSGLDALEALSNRDNNSLYSQKFHDVKNIIYQNIYNNLTYINKSKGTEKSFRNLLRCFGLEDEIYKINVYGNNVEYTFRNNYRSTAERHKLLNFNNIANSDGTVYLFSSSLNANSLQTFITASENYDSFTSPESGIPFSVEANITFPFRAGNYGDTKILLQNATSRENNYPLIETASLFGMHTAIGTTPEETTWANNDYANFIVKAVKPETYTDKAYFALTGTAGGFIHPELTSPEYNDVYNDTNWSFLVSLYPQTYPNANQVAGTSGSGDGGYVVSFSGMQRVLDVTIEQFTVTGTITGDQAIKFMASPKRCFVGAHRTNFTGSLLNQSDFKFNNLKIWQNKLSISDLESHASDPNSYGISNPEQNAYLFNTSINNVYVPNKETLLLYWNFDNVTGSDANGEFIVDDMTSGSINQVSRYGWLSDINKRQYLGKAYEFKASSTNVVVLDEVTTAKPNLPEVINSGDMITVMQNDDIYFTRDKRPIFFDLYIEKSPYQNISEEMLKFMAGVVDFNNLIGQPVDAYRQEYKALNILRQSFFQRIKNVPDIDKYVEYFKWFDVAIASMIQKIAPMSSGLDERPLRTIIESHILERNKYQNKFPSYEFKQPDPVASVLGINEMLYDWKSGHAPLSDEQYDNCLWWKDRAKRTNPAITSGDADIDEDRDSVLSVLNNQNNVAAPNLSGSSGGYEGSTYALRRFARPYKVSSDLKKQIHGGSNTYTNKKIGFWDAIRQRPTPAGTSEGAIITIEPTESELEDFKNCKDDSTLRLGKRKHAFSAQTSINGNEFTTEDKFKGDLIYPFSLYSSSIDDDTSRGNLSDFQANLDVTNLHSDAYGPFNEVPMQGPFTEKYVGGRPYRHVFTQFTRDNDPPAVEGERIEGWMLSASSTALDISNPDSPKSVYFRDGLAKRPVNIANIQQLTGATVTEDSYINPVYATVIGNYTKGYELVMTDGRSINNRYLAESDGDLPTTSTDNINISGALDFALPRRDLTGSNSFIIVNRFSSPGDPATMGEGMLDVAAGEYSVYNSLPWRNLSVRLPLNELYSDHCKQFGYFSDAFNSASYVLAGITYPGTSGSVNTGSYYATDAYQDATASFHKINRNRRRQPKYDDEYNGADGTTITASVYDNWFVQHQIPQTDLQYAWITASVINGYSGPATYGFEKPDFSNASLTSTDLTFASGTQNQPGLGAYAWSCLYLPSTLIYASSNEQAKGPGSCAGQPGTWWFPNDFVGLNTLINDPIDSVNNSLGTTWPGPGEWDYLAPPYAGGLIYNTFEAAAPFILNGLLTHRDGLWGGTNWKLYRKSNHPIVRAHRQENRLSYLQSEQIYVDGDTSVLQTRAIASVIEPPITSKFKPLRHRLKVKQDLVTGGNVEASLQDVSIDHTYLNNLAYFTDHAGVGLDLDQKILSDRNKPTAPQTLDAINYYLLGGELPAYLNPITEFKSLVIKETIYPKGQYTYLSGTRERVSYQNGFWRDSRQTRSDIEADVMNAWKTACSTEWKAPDADGSCAGTRPFMFYNPFFKASYLEATLPLTTDGVRLNPAAVGYNISASIWSLDARLNYTTGSPGRIASGSAEGYPAATYWTPVVSGASDQAGILQNNCYPYSLVSRLGYSYGFSLLYTLTLLPQYNRRIAGVIPQDLTHEYKFGDTKWEAADQSGIKPFYDTYADYVNEIKRTGKDHGIIPEFRISEHMDFYLNDKAGNFLAKNPNSFTITGSALSSSAESDFYKTYSHTDFLKTFSIVNDDYKHIAGPDKITLSIDALIKFLPYDGFYPADRTVQLARLFWQSYSSSFAITGNLHNVYANTDFTLADSVDFPLAQAGMINPLWKPLFAPGILYNSIKSGMAVDYPVHTDLSSSIAQPGDRDYRPLVVSGSPNMRRSDNGYLEDIPRISSRFDYRVPFEALVDPVGELGDLRIINNEPHSSASMNLTASLAGEGKTNYSLAMNNFLASTVQFFKPHGKLTTLASQPLENQAFDTSKEYAMKIVCSNAKYMKESSIEKYFAGNTDTLGSASFKWNPSTLAMYEQTGSDPTPRADYYGSSFGPPCENNSLLCGPGGGYEDGDVPIPLFSSASYEPYTPPYHNGYSHIQLTYKPKQEEPTLGEILIDVRASASFQRYTTGFHLFDVGVAGLDRMQLTSSLNWDVQTTQKNVEFDAQGNALVVGSDGDGDANIWVIQPKWETPVLNFKDVDVTLPLTGSGSVARGMWHQYGSIPKSNEGIFLQIQDLDESELGANTPELTASLADALGFKKSPVKVGKIAEQKKISEAIVAIPFFKGLLGNDVRFTISKDVIGLADEFVDKKGNSATFDSQVGNNPELKPDVAVIDMVRKMKKFVIPPRFDFLTNDTVDPFAMFIFDFEVTLDQQDLANIWQNLSPDIGTSFQKKKASLPMSIFAPSKEKGTGMMGSFSPFGELAGVGGLPDNVQWMVFKVKQRAAYNYFAMTADSKDDDRFKFNFEIGSADAEKTSVPDYSYNWPYDFFSLIELAKIDAEINMAPIEGVNLPKVKDPDASVEEGYATTVTGEGINEPAPPKGTGKGTSGGKKSKDPNKPGTNFEVGGFKP